MSNTRQGASRPVNRTILLRGGRVTKFKGQVASFAPALGAAFSGVSAVALGAAVIFTGSSALAGSCTLESPGNLLCSGPADPATDVGVDVILSGPVTVTTAPGFGIHANVGGNAIDLFSETGVTFTDTDESSITSNSNDAIRAVVDFGDDLSVTTNGTLSGGNFGIYARHYTLAELPPTEGAISISAANVSGARSDGIYARNDNKGGISITTSGTVSGVRRGIGAINNGAGALSISTVDVTGLSAEGIVAQNSGTDLTITSTGQISGNTIGIRADNAGSGALTISAASVTGYDGRGISAVNQSTGTDLSITTTGAVSGGDSRNAAGIYARNEGSGALTLSVADVTGTNDRGINAFNFGTDLSVTASGTVRGDDHAIYAGNRGTGGLTIDVQDAISTGDGYGINARNQGSGALVISAANVTGSGNDSGLSATNYGTDLSITTTGLVTGNWRGISALNNGTGDMTLSVVDVTSTRLNGLNLTNRGANLSVTSSGTISAVTKGIEARNEGSGALTISAVNVTGTNEEGIYARNDATGTDLTISSTGSVIGGTQGITALNFGTGGLTIEAVNVTGTSLYGIEASNSAGTDLSITTTGTIQGGRSGIDAQSDYSGTSTIDVSGSVIGGNVAGIYARTGAAGLSIIELRQGAVVSATSGTAIINNDGNSRVNLAAGSAVAGAVRLNGGDDALTIEGGADISTATLFDGGAGAQDALTFSAFTGTFNGTLFTNWESLTADNGSTLNLEDVAAGLGLVVAQNGSNIAALDADLNLAGSLQVDATSSFLAGHAGTGNVVINGDTFNDGLIRLADGQSGDQFTVGGDLSGNGAVALDVGFASNANDQINVSGDTAGAQQGLQVQKTGGSEAALQNITLATVSGSSTASDFQLVGDFVAKNGQGAVNAGAYAFFLDYDATSGEFFLTPFDENGGVYRNPDRAFLAAGVQQYSDHMILDGALRRLSGRTSGPEGETVTRSLIDLSTTDQPLIWLIAEGGRDSYTFESRENETTSGGLRVGASLPLVDIGGGSLIGGLEFGAASLSTTSDTSLADGKIDTDAYDVTLSALWLAGSQLYLDGQLRYAYFDSTTRLAGGQEVDTDGDGFAASVEVGRIFALDNGLNLIPQAQLLYTDVDADDLTDVTGGGTGTVSDGDTLSARLGLRAEHELGGVGVFYGQLDYIHAFDNETRVTFGNDTVLTERGKNNVALTLGGHTSLSEGTVLFGEVSAQRGFDGGSDDHGYAGQIGLEFRF